MTEDQIKAIEEAYMFTGSLAKTSIEDWPDLEGIRQKLAVVAEGLRWALDNNGTWIGVQPKSLQ